MVMETSPVTSPPLISHSEVERREIPSQGKKALPRNKKTGKGVGFKVWCFVFFLAAFFFLGGGFPLLSGTLNLLGADTGCLLRGASG